MMASTMRRPTTMALTTASPTISLAKGALVPILMVRHTPDPRTRAPTMMASMIRWLTTTASTTALMMVLPIMSPAKGALVPVPMGGHTPDPRKTWRRPGPTPPSGGPRSTRPRVARSTKAATLGMAVTDSVTVMLGMAVMDSVTVWLGSKLPWPCQDQQPLALQSAHRPATKVPTKSGHGFSVKTFDKDVSSGEDFYFASRDKVTSAGTDDKLNNKTVGAALRTRQTGAAAGGRRLCRCCLLAETPRTYRDTPEALPVFYQAVQRAPEAQRWPGG
jgi:hypothetical protein